MSRPFAPQDASGVILIEPEVGILLAYGDAKPTDTDPLYAPGCLFWQYDGTAVTSLSINISTVSSADFNGFAEFAIADAGSLITATTIEGALQELAQHVQTAQATLEIPIGCWKEVDGTELLDFADGASDVPGISAADESYGVRWNNHAAPLGLTQEVGV